MSRNLVETFDNRIEDFRKSALTFITGLLTAQGLIVAIFSSTGVVPPTVKFGILLSTLVLIAASCLVEKNYRLLQNAAATRCEVLELQLGLGLTGEVHAAFDFYKIPRYGLGIYASFILATTVLGFFVLYPAPWGANIPTGLEIGLIVSAVAAAIIVFFLSEQSDTMDVEWFPSTKTARVGDIVRFTAVNCSAHSVKFESGDRVWRVEWNHAWADSSSEGNGLSPATTKYSTYGSWCEDDRAIPPDGWRVWDWDTSGFEPGVYSFSFTTRMFAGLAKGFKLNESAGAVGDDLEFIPSSILVALGR